MAKCHLFNEFIGSSQETSAFLVFSVNATSLGFLTHPLGLHVRIIAVLHYFPLFYNLRVPTFTWGYSCGHLRGKLLFMFRKKKRKVVGDLYHSSLYLRYWLGAWHLCKAFIFLLIQWILTWKSCPIKVNREFCGPDNNIQLGMAISWKTVAVVALAISLIVQEGLFTGLAAVAPLAVCFTLCALFWMQKWGWHVWPNFNVCYEDRGGESHQIQ